MSAPSKPSGLIKFIARLPILLYRIGLGWVLGNRMLMLHHTGRKSGKNRKVVLEVLRHAQGVYIIASGWGEKADWYKNLLATPEARIEVGKESFDVTAQFLAYHEAERELQLYARQHPIAARVLKKLFSSHEDQSWEELAQQFRLVRLVPTS